jgi:hypothetical protein
MKCDPPATQTNTLWFDPMEYVELNRSVSDGYGTANKSNPVMPFSMFVKLPSNQSCQIPAWLNLDTQRYELFTVLLLHMYIP